MTRGRGESRICCHQASHILHPSAMAHTAELEAAKTKECAPQAGLKGPRPLFRTYEFPEGGWRGTFCSKRSLQGPPYISSDLLQPQIFVTIPSSPGAGKPRVRETVPFISGVPPDEGESQPTRHHR